MTVGYLRDTAEQAGLATRGIFIEDLGWDPAAGALVDLDGAPIAALFKLYPWEGLVADELGELLPVIPVMWFEPAWKMILSNKAILPILWELFPDHPNLLPAAGEPLPGAWVRKPRLGREGANVSIRAPGIEVDSAGPYADTGFVYQTYTELGEHDGMRPVIGSWLIGGCAAGIGIRETTGYVTGNTARFAPPSCSRDLCAAGAAGGRLITDQQAMQQARAVEQRPAVTPVHDPAAIEDDRMLGERQRDPRVLLDHDDRHAGVGPQRADHADQVLGDDRRQPLERLVEQQQPRVGHQRARDRQHLLLATRQLVAEVVAPPRQAGEQLVDPWRGPPARPRDREQVLVHGERGEHQALLRDPADAGAAALEGRHRMAVAALPAQRAAVQRGQPHHRDQQRGLAHAIAAEHRERVGLGDGQRHAVEHDRRAVAGGDVVEREQRGHR
jgi:hypothetical protein